MGYRLNILIIEGLPKDDLETTIAGLELEGFTGNSWKHFTIGDTKKLSESLFDDKLRFGFLNGCTIITSNYLVEDFFRLFLTAFSTKLAKVFPMKKILFVSVVETINLCGYTLILNNSLQRCRVDLGQKFAQFDREDLLIGTPLIDEPDHLDISYLDNLTKTMFGFIPWYEEVQENVIMNVGINLSSDLILAINDHLTNKRKITMFHEQVGEYLLGLGFKYLKTKKIYLKKLDKNISFQVKPEVIIHTLYCDYLLIHNSKLLTHQDMNGITIPSGAEIKDNSTGVRIKYNYDAIPNRHAKTVKNFSLYMAEIRNHLENTVLNDIESLMKHISAS
ncbi:hypothetical protein [Haliscomenobacter sp.]|uniref:hypothetical protein n=1 Tax=Haliscomenobacter sp. TaxID=2717303 RepID=UPI003BAB2A36